MRTVSRAVSITAGVLLFAVNALAAPAVYRTSSPAAYAKRVSFTLDSTYVAEGVTLTNFPLLVRLSTKISGFSYDDFLLPNGGDMMFTDETGATLSYDVDEWNVGGTSYVWVRVPRLTASTVLTLRYGNGACPVLNPADTWREYHAVWHFNEDGGPAFDASGNGRVAMPIGDTRGQQSRVAAKVGYGRQNVKFANLNVGMTGFLHGGTLSLGGWYTASYNTLLFDGRTDFGLDDPYNSTKIIAKVNGTSLTGDPGGHTGQYLTHIGYSVYGDTIDIFGQGAAGKATGTIAKGKMDEAIGDLHLPGSTAASTIDEWRIKKTATSSAWENADYQGMNKTTCVVAGAVETEEAGVVVMAPTVEKTVDGWEVSVRLDAGNAQLAIAYVCGDTAVTNDITAGVVTAPQTAVDVPTGLAAGKVYRVVALAKDANGAVISATEGTGLCTDTVTVSRAVDAGSSSAGLFTVTLGDGTRPSDEPILVKYTTGGTAVSGEDFLPLSGEVWIPSGATKATVPVVALGLVSRLTSLVLTLAPGAYAVGDESSAAMNVESERDPADLVWTALPGTRNFETPANWTPQYTPGDRDTVALPAVDGVVTTARLTPRAVVSQTTFSPSEGGVACLDLNGQLYYNNLNLSSSGDGTAVLSNGVFSGATFTFEGAALRLEDLVVTNRTEDGTVAFNRAGQSVVVRDVVHWAMVNSQAPQVMGLTADDIVFVATNFEVRPVNPGGSGNNLLFNVKGKRIKLDLTGVKTYVKGGVVFDATSENCVVTLREGVTAGGWTGAGRSSFTMDGASNVLQFLSSGAKSTLSYPKINGEGNVLRAGEGGNLSVGNATAFNGTGNRIESYGTLAFTGAFNFGTDAASSGNRLLVSGDDAVISFSDAFKVGNNAEGNDPLTLEFITGASPWTEAPVRLTSTSATLSIVLSNTVFAVDAAPALDAMKKNRCKLPLMSFKSANATNVDWTAFNDTLVMPRLQHGTLRLETALSSKGAFSSATLWCDVKRDIGLMILVR